MKTITVNFPAASLLEVLEKNKDLVYPQTWYKDETFANEQIPAGTWEVSLEPVKDSLSKNWDEQQELIGKDSEVPPAAVLAYAIFQHFKDTGERAFENVYVRTSSLDSGGDRVIVGSFDAKGLGVNDDWDYRRRSVLGVASARKLSVESLGATEPLEDLSLERAIEIVKEAGYKGIKEL